MGWRSLIWGSYKPDLRSGKPEQKSERPDFGSEKPDLRSLRLVLGFERRDFWSERPDLGSERLDLRSGRPGVRLGGNRRETGKIARSTKGLTEKMACRVARPRLMKSSVTYDLKNS